MSVVNKMLQDLEARKSNPDDVSTDYQPPQKQSSKRIVYTLLVVAIGAIIFALYDMKQLFESKPNNEHTPSTQTSPSPLNKKTMRKPTETPRALLAEPEVINTAIEPTKMPIDDNPELSPNNEGNAAQSSETENSPAILEIPTPDITNDNPILTQSSELTQVTEEPQKPTSFTMSDSTQAQQSTSLKQQIAESLNNNDLDLAQTLLSELLLDEPNNLKARKKLASLYFAQGDYAQTKQLLVMGIELYPKQTDLRLMLARLYAVQKEPAKALEIMKDAVPDISNQIEYLAYRAALAQQLKQPKISKADYLALTLINSTEAKWWLGLAIAQDQLGDAKQAIQSYENAYSLGQLDNSVSEFMKQRISVLVGTQ